MTSKNADAEPVETPRASIYGPDDRKAVLDEIASGKTMMAVCRMDGFPSYDRINDWEKSNIDEFAPALASARLRGAEALALQAIELSDEALKLERGKAYLIAAYRLKIDVLMKMAAALDPAAYGKQIKHSGMIGHAHGHVVIDATDFLAPAVMDRVRALRDAGQLQRKDSLVIEAMPDEVTADGG